MRYLKVEVMGRDCTNNGVSSTHKDNLVVPCEEGNYSAEDVKEYGYEILELQASNLKGEVYGHEVPPHFIPNGEKRHTMFGGNYVTGDSRFTRKYGWSPLSVHDRIEA